MSRLLILSIFIVLLAACSPAAPATDPAQPTTVPPSPVVEDTAVPATSQVEEPTDEASPEPLEPTAIAEAVQTDSCVECHSDKDTLIAVAEPEQVLESESSGEG